MSLIKATTDAIRGSPREIFNPYLFLCTWIWSFSGVAKGFDEGNIASLVTMAIFKRRFGIDGQSESEYSNTKGWIVAIATAGAVFGCLACVNLTEKLGRKRTMQIFTLIYIAGSLGQTFSSGSMAGLYISRIVSGNQIQWQLPTALQIAPAIIWGLGTFFTPESPRFLLSRGRPTEALKVLRDFRCLPADHPYGEEGRLLATGVYAIVKFVSVLIFSVFVIDFIGRRRSLLTGICLQITTLLFVGIYLKVTNGRDPEDISADPAARRASEAAIAAIYLHAIAWSIGWFSIPYLVSAEVFPIRIRSLCVSVLMAFHWAFYFGCSRAMPSLLAATERYGAFIFFASICSVSLVYVYLAMPETSGRSLESMENLFNRPWYTVYKVAYPKAEDLAARPVVRQDNGKEERGKEEENGAAIHLA
ncbi:hypothetical protein JMJ77_0002671 [Colletotrichum scovillei]|uniref:Major facilitator superfamily (MFS) profile domain-containing protein n=1 Tax=Colletotrichum scovillei TaxID=1209932 RepID=A0A9P7R8C4_9PEZI|nr:hypothetical protein JMJ77_0002671 [Colletotrichum scovillei]KAG7071095.1 hypothetical protein JMJ76_0002333 [Colletotrichum scovillei]KAG7079371.1 hypothetical protein JMJ78_0003025 [Colletotrichum scovillei]